MWVAAEFSLGWQHYSEISHASVVKGVRGQNPDHSTEQFG